MRRAGCFMIAGLLVALSACGDDDGSPMLSPDSGDDASMMRVDAGAPPMCGTSTCGSPLVGEHCCTRRQDVVAGLAVEIAHCGVDLGSPVPRLVGVCVELRQPGALDVSCPPRSVGTSLERGCCMPDGVCGTLNESLDLGCQRALSGSEPPLACGRVSLDAGDGRDAQ